MPPKRPWEPPLAQVRWPWLRQHPLLQKIKSLLPHCHLTRRAIANGRDKITASLRLGA
ncbi:MAG: hypothetical protein IPL28_17210 [Chloroflexi bacterium]|nr:hypothetical protein [Chloroflexota bacterium]